MAIQNTLMDAIQKHREGMAKQGQEKAQMMLKHRSEHEAMQLKHQQEIRALAAKHQADPAVNNEHVQAYRQRMQGYAQQQPQPQGGQEAQFPPQPGA